MSILEWFGNKEKLSTKPSEKLNIPGELWVKCFSCKETLFLKDLEENLKVCPKCEHHFRLTAKERRDLLCDKGSFTETHDSLKPKDFLKFSDTEAYADRIKKAQKNAQRA